VIVVPVLTYFKKVWFGLGCQFGNRYHPGNRYDQALIKPHNSMN
jgi:hypothetical protein